MSSCVLPQLTDLCQQSHQALKLYLDQARNHIKVKVMNGDKINSQAFDQHQLACHGFSWLTAYVVSLEEMAKWLDRLEEQGEATEFEYLVVQGAHSIYLSHILGGIPISQLEFCRPQDLFMAEDEILALQKNPGVQAFINSGYDHKVTARLSTIIQERMDQDQIMSLKGEDESLKLIYDQFHRFVEEKVIPHAHEWHLKDELIPLSIVEEMAEMGVFGLTVAEQYDGLNLGKLAMCVVTEELSRGYIGVGSLGTRAEIAAELIHLGGTQQQKATYLPQIVSGKILPTAVFTEPNTGSDLGSLTTRGVLKDGKYYITGNKTWITHGSRSDLMTLLCRTNPDEKGYRGLSMMLAKKPRGTQGDDFPHPNMSGGEIEVLGYRGMKEYELSFDEFPVDEDHLLGEKEGQGFKQLMATFEGARIQTAARAVGVAQNALEVAMRYALDRQQFGKPLYDFPRNQNKICAMMIETIIARQLTYYSARAKDAGARCDIEAGMAKLLAARVAWSNADGALQIHGGNGYALEYPISRILCDARILNIFEGAAEIQAHVVARGLLTRS